MKNKINKKNGFTLIELIVSVTIIAVLTVVGVVSYTGTNRKSRDSRRMADLEKIRIGLELYRQSVGSTYPADGTLTAKLKPTYMTEIPVDPKTNSNYLYSSSSYTYFICANVEDAGSTTADVFGCSGLPATGYAGYYKVKNP